MSVRYVIAYKWQTKVKYRQIQYRCLIDQCAKASQRNRWADSWYNEIDDGENWLYENEIHKRFNTKKPKYMQIQSIISKEHCYRFSGEPEKKTTAWWHGKLSAERERERMYEWMKKICDGKSNILFRSEMKAIITNTKNCIAFPLRYTLFSRFYYVTMYSHLLVAVFLFLHFYYYCY